MGLRQSLKWQLSSQFKEKTCEKIAVVMDSTFYMPAESVQKDNTMLGLACMAGMEESPPPPDGEGFSLRV